MLRQGLVFGTMALQRRMLVSLEINNKDRAYEWFLAWMSHQNLAQRSSRVPWIRSHQLSVETTVEQRKNGSSSAVFKLVAGPGTHYFRYRGAWMQARTSPNYVSFLIVYIQLTGETRARNAVNATHVRCALGNSHANSIVSRSLTLSPLASGSERSSNARP